jgi:TolB protein
MLKKAILIFICLMSTIATHAQVNSKRITNVQDSYPNPSPDGKSIVFQSNRSGVTQLYLSDSIGNNIRQITFTKGENQTPIFSPTGDKIVFCSTRDEDDPEIYIMNADGTNQKRLTVNKGDESHPHWSPDGKKIIFNSARTSPDLSSDWGKQFHELFIMDEDGRNSTQLTFLKSISTYPNISPDGKFVAFRHFTQASGLTWDLNESKRNSEIFRMDIDGKNIINLSNHIGYDGWPCWSPDGSIIIFASNRKGPVSTGQLFAIDKDGKNLKQLTLFTGSGYAIPSWRTGNKIYAYQYWETPEYEYGNIAVIEYNE